MIAVDSGQCAKSYALARCPGSVLTEGRNPQYIRGCSGGDLDQVRKGNLVRCVVVNISSARTFFDRGKQIELRQRLLD